MFNFDTSLYSAICKEKIDVDKAVLLTYKNQNSFFLSDKEYPQNLQTLLSAVIFFSNL